MVASMTVTTAPVWPWVDDAQTSASFVGHAGARYRGFMLDEIRAGYEALMAEDPEPLVGLMDTQMEWRGRRRPFWHAPPS
jgi:hypothetical protein